MDHSPSPSLARRIAPAVLALACGLPAWAQQPASVAPPLPAAMRDKLAATRADPKAMEHYLKLGQKTATFCANCHGPSGQSVRPDVPNLAGQNPAYVLNQIVKFGEGKRRGAFFMEGLVKAMSQDERMAVAIYYTSQPPRSQPVKDAALVARGKKLFESQCVTCHGDKGAGDETIARIAGQQQEYLYTAIKQYREGVRFDERMIVGVRLLGEDDIKAVAAYVASL